MLLSLECDKFRQRRIDFNPGLNVIQGDAGASNSIGKSTSLLIIDFVFGGGNFLEGQSNVVPEIGDHFYTFELRFSGKDYRFRRKTSDPKVIYTVDNSGAEISQMTLEEYLDFLKLHYELSDEELSFRAAASLTSRIAGNKNLNPSTPLNIVSVESGAVCVYRLIRLFGRAGDLSVIAGRSQELKRVRKAIAAAAKNLDMPTPSRSAVKKNLELIAEIDSEIRGIQANLRQYAVSAEDLVGGEVSKLRIKQREISSRANGVISQLARIRKNLEEQKYLKPRGLDRLTEFFPAVNAERISEIESFHSGLASIMKKHLREAEGSLKVELKGLQQERERISARINEIIPPMTGGSSLVVDKLMRLTSERDRAIAENLWAERKRAVADDLKEVGADYDAQFTEALKDISRALNADLSIRTFKIYGDKRRPPVISATPHSYGYSTLRDTGTGKAFLSLVLFDIAMANLAEAPFIIHDSILFGNVSARAIDFIVDDFANLPKQVFITVDSIQKYSRPTISTLESATVLRLTETSLLYEKDWRSRSK